MDCTPATCRGRVPAWPVMGHGGTKSAPCEMVRRLIIHGVVLAAMVPAAAAAPPPAALSSGHPKLDLELRQRARAPRGHSRVILRLDPGVSADAADAIIRNLRGTLGRRLASGRGLVASVPDTALAALARLPGVNAVSLDRRVHGTMERTGATVGATWVQNELGLDGSGQGFISNVIAAIDYAIANKDALGLRILNLSVAAGVYESYETDPLTLAARRAVDAGLIVVSAAGNLGKGPDGKPQYGAIGAPGNAPWVITVGASSHNGTIDRSDDSIAGFSSRGPTALDFQTKPDIVAPGVGIESLTEAGSTLFNTKPLMRLWGTVPTANEPYLPMSGTSMAAPAVSGTIALMPQTNPAPTPTRVKPVMP